MADQVDEKKPTQAVAAEETATKKKKKGKKKKSTTNKETDEFITQFKEKYIPSFLKTMNDPNWKLEKEKKNLKIYRLKDDSSPIHKVKGETTVNCTCKEMEEFLDDFQLAMPTADTMFAHGETLYSSKNVNVQYAAFNMPGYPLVSNRDFIWLEYRDSIDNNTGISVGFSTSEVEKLKVDNSDKKGYVRAWIQESGYYWTKMEGDTLKLTYIVQADVKGWLPVWVANLAAADQASNALRIRQYFNKKKGVEYDETDSVTDVEDGEDEESGKTDDEKSRSNSNVNNNTNNNGGDNGSQATAAKKKKKKKKKAQKQPQEPQQQAN